MTGVRFYPAILYSAYGEKEQTSKSLLFSYLSLPAPVSWCTVHQSFNYRWVIAGFLKTTLAVTGKLTCFLWKLANKHWSNFQIFHTVCINIHLGQTVNSPMSPVPLTVWLFWTNVLTDAWLQRNKVQQWALTLGVRPQYFFGTTQNVSLAQSIKNCQVKLYF